MRVKWQKIRLGEVLKSVDRGESPLPGKIYRQIGVKLWGEGAYEREPIDGADTRYSKFFRAETNDVIVNKIWARNGSVAAVTAELNGCYGSGEFPMFKPIRDRLDSRWMHWLTKTPFFWSQCDEKSQGTSGKNRIRPERFLEITISLPSLEEQRRIVARIEELAAQINEAGTIRRQAEIEEQQMLEAAFVSITDGVRNRPLGDVAPIIRRAVKIEVAADYPELGIRSFGKGTFHKPPINGLSLGTKRLFQIYPGDLVFNNVFAWEGAVAVAQSEDEGRFGSHRFITCTPRIGTSTSNFLRFFFLTKEGLSLLGEASPGGAGRNRTLGVEALMRIPVPLPDYRAQNWFDNLQGEVGLLKRTQSETTSKLDALFPSILDKALKGEL